MPDEKAQLLGKIFDALFEAEFCAPNEKARQEAIYNELLRQASEMSGKSVGLIKEAFLKSRYPQYRRQRDAQIYRGSGRGIHQNRRTAHKGRRRPPDATLRQVCHNRAIQLRGFAGIFQNSCACDIGKEHLVAFIESLGEFSAKSRDHHRCRERAAICSRDRRIVWIACYS